METLWIVFGVGGLFALAAGILTLRDKYIGSRRESTKLQLKKEAQEIKTTLFGFLALGIVILVIAVLWNWITGSGILYHTERVLADVGGEWLAGEQKTCLYERHRNEDTAYLLCDTGHGFHNIPVRFSGMAPSDEDLKKLIRQE